MALAKKCDRCGKLYEHDPTGNNPKYNALRLIQKKQYRSNNKRQYRL